MRKNLCKESSSSACRPLQQRVVIDNTNPSQSDRKKYIEKFQKARYEIVGYYFQSLFQEALARNQKRLGKARIPDAGLAATYKKLELPTFSEGFDALYYVKIVDEDFEITPWKDEI